MDQDEAQANLADMVMEALNEGREVSVILDGISERIVVTDSLHEGGVIDIVSEGDIEYRACLRALKVVILGSKKTKPRPTLRSVPKSSDD